MNPALSDNPFENYLKTGKAYTPKGTAAQRAASDSANPFENYLKTGEVKKKEDTPSSASSAPSGFQLSSESVSTEGQNVPQTPSGFLANDIDESFSFQKNNFAFEDFSEPVTPAEPGFKEQQDKEKQTAQILSEPKQLKEYSKNRVTALQSDINRLQTELQKYKQPNLYLAASPGAPIETDVTYTEGSQPILEEVAAKKKYLEDLKSNVQNVAAYAVVSKEDLSDVSDAKLKTIGAKYLQTINDATVGDDLTVLKTMDATGASRSDADRSSQNIDFKLYKNGANAVARYYGDVAEDIYKKNEGKINDLNDLMNKQATEQNPANKEAYQSAINALMQDDGVKSYISASGQAMQYEKKSRDAMDQFPQVKRQAMRQQLSDAYFRMATTKEAMTRAINPSDPTPLLNWIFGDQATEKDIPALSKETGIPEEQVREIVNSDIKGWFGSADEAGVRIPGMLTGVAQAADETLAKAVMGTRRFFNVDNAEAKNRLLSDRIQDYNLRAQKAKLFDDSGKLNFNPYSVMNTIGTGVGQTAIYAAPSLITGGAASGLAASEKIGKLMSVATTTGTGFVGSYEDGYKEAAQYTDDENLRRAYALKVGLVNGLSESILEPADIARKIGVGAKMNKGSFDAFEKTFKNKGTGAAIESGLKEFGKVVGTENVEELIALVGETKAKESDLGVITSPGEFINNAIETAVTTTLATLPLGIGAGINGTRDQSNILKQGLYEAGNEPDLYKSRLEGLLNDGTLNQDQYNERVSVVNTMAKIVPSIKPTDVNGNPLTYEQKSTLAAEQFRILNNRRLLENPDIIEAEKPIIEADINASLEKQTAIISGTPSIQGENATASQPDENIPMDVRNDLVEKIKSIEATNPLMDNFKSDPDAAISFIQEQATGMDTPRDYAGEPTYTETVKMFGEDIVNQAVSILPQDQKDMIIKSWDAQGIQAPPQLLKSLQSTNTTTNESQNSKSSNQETRQASQENDSNANQEGQIGVPAAEKYSAASPFILGEESRNKIQGISNRIQNAEYINESELDAAADVLYDVLSQNPDNKSFQNLIEPLISQIEQYEFRTKTKTSTITEDKSTQVARNTQKRDFDKRPVIEQLSAGNATVQRSGKSLEGRILVRDGKYVLSDADGNVISSFGEKAINDRDVSIPSPEEVDNFVTLDEDGNPSAITVKLRSGDLVTFSGFKNPDVPLDLAIQMSANTISVPNEVFDTIYETVEKQYEEEVLLSEFYNEIEKDNESREQFEQFVENDEESRSEILSGSNEEVAAEESAKDNEQVQETPEKSKQRKKAERKPTEVREEPKQTTVEKEQAQTPVKPKKITTIEQAEEELRRMFAVDRLEAGVSGNLSVEEYTKRSTAILSQLYPDATINVYDSAQEYYDKTGRPVGSLGAFNPVNKNLSLNLELIKSSGATNTILHEVIHPIVNEVLLSDSETFQSKINDTWNRIEELKGVPGMDAVFEHAGKYSTLDANAQKVEGITEFLTQVADGNIDISKAPKAIATRIIDLINDLLSLIGSSARISSESDLDNLANAIKKAFQTSDASPIIKKIGERKETVAAEIMDALNPEEQERAIRDLISRSKELDQNQLKNLIKKYTNWSDEKVDSLFKKETGITHAQTSETAKEFGFEGYQQSPETFDEWDAEAMEKIKSGYDVGALVSKMSNGHMPTAVEQRMVRFYLQNLEAEVEADPSDINLTKLMAAIRASDIAGGRLVGQSLVARKGTGVRDNSLAGFFVREQEEANGGVPLTDAQKENVKKEYSAMQEAQLKLEQKMIALEKENARLKAEKVVKSEKSKTKPQKKTHTEYVEERKNIISSIKEKLKAARTGESGLTAVPVPYARELFAIAPDVLKLTRSLIEEGVSKLDDIVRDIHSQLKDSIDGLTEKDIHDIIAGDYNEKKPTRSDITKQLADLRQQAKLQNQLDALLRGESKQKTERQKTQWSKEVEDLKSKIKEIEKGDDVPVAQQKLNAIKTRTENAIKQLQGELKTGNYQEEAPEKRQLKLDKEAIDLKDKLIKLRIERNNRIAQHQYENRTRLEKIRGKAAEVLNVPRTIMSSTDLSGLLRQAVIPTVSYPDIAARASVEMVKQAVSQKRFDRWFYDLQQDPRYTLMQESGLYVADPHDPRLGAKEEAFMNNLAEKIPIAGKIIKGSERAYVGLLNKMRVDIFNRIADQFEDDGFSFSNDPKLFKDLATFVNNATGRGGIGKLESAAPLLNSVFFSPRLMASRVNMSGLSDLASLATLGYSGKGFYSNLSPRVRAKAMAGMIKFIGAGSLVLALLKYGFGGDDEDDMQIELDPRSSDFGKIRKGNTRWDIWGGFQQYVRVVAQLLAGSKKSTASGNVSALDGKGVFGENRGDVALRFIRGKLAPVPAMGVDFITGRTIVGEPVTVQDELKSHLLPLIVSDMKEAIKEEGVKSIFTMGIPSLFGVGVQTYGPRGYENVDRSKGVYKTLYDNKLNLTLPPQGDMDKKQYEKFVPAQQKIFAEEWNNVIQYGAQLNEDGGVTIDDNKAVATKPFSELTHDEKTSLMQSISKRSTRLAKEELGIEDKKEKKNQEYLNQ